VKKIVVLITMLSALCCNQTIQADQILDPHGLQKEEYEQYLAAIQAELAADRSHIDDYLFHEGLSVVKLQNLTQRLNQKAQSNRYLRLKSLT